MSSSPLTAPGAALLAPGVKLGKYRLMKRLAVGGMAEIYLARASGSEGFEKLVALKRILPQHALSEEFIGMFLNEARLAATLHHPNIAQTYDIGSDGGSYFFTMEYVHGEDMRTLLKAAAKSGQGVPLEHAINVILGVCGGLHHAHEKRGQDGKPLGIVHRDVSPSNVLVTYDGAVKLVDFGIAKATSHRAETRVGTLKGKIAYMSPEQCRGEPLDRRSDVFSIGILLYEFTTGHRLFKGDNEFAILNLIVNQDVTPPSQFRPGYPPLLEQIVLRALARERDQRYSTAEELQSDLEGFAREMRLGVSAIALGRFMEALFGKKQDPWHEVAHSAADLPLTAPADDITPGPIDLREFPRSGSIAETNPLLKRDPLLDSNLSHVVAAEAASLLPRRRWWPATLAGVAALGAIGLTVVVLTTTPAERTRRSAAQPAPVTETPAPVAAPPVPPPVLVPVLIPPPVAVPVEAVAVPVASEDDPAGGDEDVEAATDEPRPEKKKKKRRSRKENADDPAAASAPKDKDPPKKDDLDSLFPPE